MAANHWEHFPHEADIGVRGVGTTKEQAFKQAALALTAVIIDPRELTPREPVEIACEAPDDELLLADWPNALVYQMATRRLLFGRFEVHLEGHRLRGRAWGEPLDVAPPPPGRRGQGRHLYRSKSPMRARRHLGRPVRRRRLAAEGGNDGPLLAESPVRIRVEDPPDGRDARAGGPLRHRGPGPGHGSQGLRAGVQRGHPAGDRAGLVCDARRPLGLRLP